MIRAQLIAAVWNWLPAFRAVAEVQSVHGAAAKLHVAPSGISRTLSLLEDRVGKRLFERSGRTLVLNDAGKELLASVRTSMRLIDDSLATLSDEAPNGHLKLCAPVDTVDTLLVPVMAGIVREHAGVRFSVAAAAPNLETQLLTGELDLVLSASRIQSAALTNVSLQDLPVAVFVRPNHPLKQAKRVTLAHCRELGFIEVAGSASSQQLDHEAKVSTPSVSSAIATLLETDLCGVLPIGQSKRLGQLAVSLPPVRLWAIRRKQLQEADLISMIVDRLGAR